ncbi:MAG: hypothetical protein ACRC6I_21195, partial [Paracoccaceae bacterium]
MSDSLHPGCVDQRQAGRGKAIDTATPARNAIMQKAACCIHVSATQRCLDRDAIKDITLGMAAADLLQIGTPGMQVHPGGRIFAMGKGLQT